MHLSLPKEMLPTRYLCVSHWKLATFRCFSLHMQRWFTTQPRAPLLEVVQAGAEEIAQYVRNTAREPDKYQVVAQLESEE